MSNLDVSGDIGPKIETLKEEIKASSTKMFNIAEDSLKNNNGLEKVILLKRIFRCDTNLRSKTISIYSWVYLKIYMIQIRLKIGI